VKIALPAILFLTLTIPTTAEKISTERQPFTTDQIAEHLGIKGGNYPAKFKIPCYCGFKIIDNTQDVPVSTTFWSENKSDTHIFTFKHSTTTNDYKRFTRTNHDVSFGSTQTLQNNLAAPEPNFRINAKSLTYNFGTQTNGIQLHLSPNILKIDKLQPLYTWKTHDGKIIFQLSVIFSQTKDQLKKSEENNQ